MSKLDVYKATWKKMTTDELDNLHQQVINGKLNLRKLQREALFEVWHERHKGDIKGL